MIIKILIDTKVMSLSNPNNVCLGVKLIEQRYNDNLKLIIKSRNRRDTTFTYISAHRIGCVPDVELYQT